MIPTSCLNEYHQQFLKLFVAYGCRFLIVGGQARSIYEGTATRDLDVWVDISSANRPTLDLALVAWATEHRMHSSVDFSQLPLRRCVQIKFPEVEAYYLGANGKLETIVPEEGVDVLTSIKSADFNEYYDRVYWREVVGVRLPFLARDNLSVISPNKPST